MFTLDAQTLTQIISMLKLLHYYRDKLPIRDEAKEEIEALIKKLRTKKDTDFSRNINSFLTLTKVKSPVKEKSG